MGGLLFFLIGHVSKCHVSVTVSVTVSVMPLPLAG